MEKEEELGTDLCRTRIQDDEQKLQRATFGFDRSGQSFQLMRTDNCRTVGVMDCSQLAGDEKPVAGSELQVTARMDASVSTGAMMKVEKLVVAENSLGKRKRGRPQRSQGRATPVPKKEKEKEEDDVCFICFDGGSLVLCDTRGCPKAYHPACIKRDESFFQSKAKWSCGWHICNSCQNASYFMCYTCTYSLCKWCTKDADYVRVRGSMGFCGTCMRTIMLLENSGQGNKEAIQVDFDDVTSWEYLFKMYWTPLKAKLSLTLNELTLGKNPWQDGSVMENENAKRRKTRKQQNLPYKMNSQIMEMSSCNNNNVMPLPKGTEWATKELLDFVAHMKNGDASVLSPFDVELLLLEYIKRHNLRDPKQKSQILCDLRLVHLFGKPSVGHFEMMKLLESHFLIKEKSLVDDIGTVSEVASDQVKSKGNCDHQQPMGDSDRCKPLEKANERAQHIDSDEYAAIDVHNISLIFLQRKLIESLLNDTDRFHGKVVGSFVRLRVSSNDTKQDMYRLAQVIGTTKIAESYKVGERTSNLMLEVQNLDKKEALSIDSFSDQDFSEEECRCLRESVKCGLIRRFTVGEIRDKASTLQAVKANDIPISAEERQRTLHEIIEVHTDQNTDPSQVSEENAKKLNKINQEGIMTPNDSVSHRKDRELIYQQQGGNVLNFIGNTVSNNLACTSERSKNICTPFNLDKEGVNGTIKKVNETSTREREALVLNSWDASQKQSNFTSLLTSNDNPIVGSEALLPPFTSEIEHFVNEVEADRLWHYQDPAGKIQGPFSITQLHKWYSSRCFPTNLRVWRTNESQSEAVFLSDALNALYKYDKESQFLYNIHVLSKEDKPNFSGCDDKKDLVKGNGSASQSSDGPPSTSQRSGLEQVQDPLKDKNSWHGESQGHFSVPSPPLPEKPLELSRVSEVHAMERHSSPSKVNHNSQKNAEGETISCNSYEKSDSEDCSDQSSHGWDSKSSVVSLPTTIELPEQSQEIHIPNLPTTSGSKLDHVDLNDQSTEIKPSPFSCVTDQASDPIWTSSTLVAPMPTKPSIQEQDSSLIAESSLKPVEIINANVATPASVNDLPNDSHVSSWQAIIDGPDDEFDSLVDESVSDLLAEVEAMETLHALASSSTSMINCGGELTLGSKNYFFTSEPGFSPATEIGKSIHLTSSTDLQMTSQPATIPPTSHLSSSSVVVENAPIQPSVPSPSSLNIALGDTGWRTGSENAVPDWSPVQENNANMNWEYSNQGNADSGFGNFPARGNPVGFYSSQPRYNADRFPSPRERSFQDRDYGFGKGSRSSSWNRSQPSYGGGNGGSSSRPSPRGQRVCKFYENGYCRKGASCSYLHP